MSFTETSYSTASQADVGSDGAPGFQHVVRLAQRLVEYCRQGHISTSEVEEIVGLWDDLPEADKGPVNYPPRYRVKESFNKRYVSCCVCVSAQFSLCGLGLILVILKDPDLIKRC